MSDPRQATATPLPLELVDWPRRLAREEALITRVLAETPSKRVLDLGCGTGEHTRLMAGLGYEVVAIDASEPALDSAQEQLIPDGRGTAALLHPAIACFCFGGECSASP